MKFSNMQISTRLGFGFGTMLFLMAILTGVGVWRLHAVAAISEALVATEMRQDRYISRWLSNIEVNAARTNAAAKTVDPGDEKYFVNSIAASSQGVSDLLPLIDAGLRPGGKVILADALDARKAYQAARTAMFKVKAGGDLAAARAMFEQNMKPKLDDFTARAKKLSQYQHGVIDAMGLEIGAQYREGKTTMLALTTLALLVGAAYSWWISRSITTPMRRAVQVARTVAAGDLTSRIEAGGKDETGQLLDALSDMNASLAGIVGQVRSGTDSIAHASREIAAGNLDLSTRTEQQAGTLEESATAIEQLSGTVRQNGDNARQAHQMAASASGVALRGGAMVAELVATMGEINTSSRKMADIISVIDGIAFQTNILALNAAVEAARAGEQGRGFAVVATEVRNLAQRAAGAAKEIKNLIDNSVDRVSAGSKLVLQAGGTMDEIVASVKRVTDIMGEITAASQEQITGIEQINQAVGQMDTVTQQNAALVEEAAAATDALQSQASVLAGVVSVFKLGRQGTGAPARPRVVSVNTTASRPGARPALAAVAGLPQRWPT